MPNGHPRELLTMEREESAKLRAEVERLRAIVQDYLANDRSEEAILRAIAALEQRQ